MTKPANRLTRYGATRSQIDDLLITLADCLKDHISSGVSDTVVREQLQMYAES